MDYNLDNFYIFCHVVRLGSMKAASEALEIPLSTVSRRIANLEEHVSSPLFIRSKTTLILTSVGREYYEQLANPISTLCEEIDAINAGKKEIVGKVTIDCTDLVYQRFLKADVQQLMLKHPKLKLRFIPSADITTIHPDADIAILAGELPDSSIVAKKLLSNTLKIVASPTLSSQAPTHLADLKSLDFIGQLNSQRVTGVNCQNGSIENVILHPKLSLSDPKSIVEIVERGLGFCIAPDYFVDSAIKSGALDEWLTDFDLGKRDIYLAYRHRTQKTAAQQLVIDMVEEVFRKF
ncbi:LysR family transcriptional regulator [Vibrio gallicus]|uniref:LysR family transcriptional regulator n=1 Tax=Vibrio gallicus TaxID=190897 RepID=UPI0021C2E9E1|nr:LysR family transcriptional regulator [Vibrio gallicus]